jgi:RNA polymerase sigma-70 factor (ECF subfamily)
MNEIHTETIDVPTDGLFSIDLFSDEDQEESELEEAAADVDEIPAPEPEVAAIPLSILDASPDLAPFQLDQEALFRELIAQHQRRLYRFVIKYIDHPDDAADITQQAFVEAARTIASFRGDSKLSTWLFGIAMNMVRNYLSRAPHRVHKFETDDSLLGLASSELDPSDSLSQRELLILAEKAFGDLPSEMSEVLGLVAVDEISYQHAADILSIPLGTVRSRVSRARAVLRAQFEQAGVKLQF